jgi:hypothetical protein
MEAQEWDVRIEVHGTHSFTSKLPLELAEVLLIVSRTVRFNLTAAHRTSVVFLKPGHQACLMKEVSAGHGESDSTLLDQILTNCTSFLRLILRRRLLEMIDRKL